jgi:AcrR family transcriptional regulator
VPRTKLRTPELRDRLLGGAMTLLEHEGAPGFTTRALARQAGTSAPAVYELFGDKSGLVRQVFFEGFRMLGHDLGALTTSEDPLADLAQTAQIYRAFMVRNRALAEVMFSRPFTDFSPGPDEALASGAVRELIVGRVERGVRSGVLHGDPTDIAHVFVALVQGMASAESAERLGTSKRSVDRRWNLALAAFFGGLGLGDATG